MDAPPELAQCRSWDTTALLPALYFLDSMVIYPTKKVLSPGERSCI